MNSADGKGTDGKDLNPWSLPARKGASLLDFAATPPSSRWDRRNRWLNRSSG